MSSHGTPFGPRIRGWAPQAALRRITAVLAWIAVVGLLVHGLVPVPPASAALFAAMPGLTGADGKTLPAEWCSATEEGHGQPADHHGDAALHCILCQSSDARLWPALPAPGAPIAPIREALPATLVAYATGLGEPADPGLPQARAPPRTTVS